MPSRITPRELADLKQQFLEQVAAGSFATVAQGVKADIAYGWGNHAAAGYASAGQGTNADTAFGWGDHATAGYASGAQGTKADTAFGWGDHSVAGYLTSATVPFLRKSVQTAVGGETTTIITPVPFTGSAVQVFLDAGGAGAPVLQAETTNYTVSSGTITWVSPAALGAGDIVHVYWVA